MKAGSSFGHTTAKLGFGSILGVALKLTLGSSGDIVGCGADLAFGILGNLTTDWCKEVVNHFNTQRALNHDLEKALARALARATKFAVEEARKRARNSWLLIPDANYADHLHEMSVRWLKCPDDVSAHPLAELAQQLSSSDRDLPDQLSATDGVQSFAARLRETVFKYVDTQLAMALSCDISATLHVLIWDELKKTPSACIAYDAHVKHAHTALLKILLSSVLESEASRKRDQETVIAALRQHEIRTPEQIEAFIAAGTKRAFALLDHDIAEVVKADVAPVIRTILEPAIAELRRACDSYQQENTRLAKLNNNLAEQIVHLRDFNTFSSARLSDDPSFDIRIHAAECFIGRAEQRRALVARLAAGKNSSVVGPAGIGKTALAAAAIAELAGPLGEHLTTTQFPEGVIVINLYRTKALVEPTMNALADEVAGIRFEPRTEARKRAVAACIGRRILVVFEGGEEATGLNGRTTLAALQEVLHPSNCRLILTRERSQSDSHSIFLDEALSADESEQLFNLHAGSDIDASIRADILQLLEGHPLAITWAASHLRQRCEHPGRLINDWRGSHLPSIADPANALHTLSWLFARSCRDLSNTELAALAIAGRLANAAFPIAAITRSLEISKEQAYKALRTLTSRSLLRVDSIGDAANWSFTHLLGYKFARATIPSDEFSSDRLAQWIRDGLQAVYSDRAVPVETALTATGHLLSHAKALLILDKTNKTGWLTEYILLNTVRRLTSLGNTGSVEAALATVEIFLDSLQAELATGLFALKLKYALMIRKCEISFAKGEFALARLCVSEAQKIGEQLMASSHDNTEFPRTILNNLRPYKSWIENHAESRERTFCDGRRYINIEIYSTQWRDYALRPIDSAFFDNAEKFVYTDRHRIAHLIRWGIGATCNRLEDAEAESLLIEAYKIADQSCRSDPHDTEWQRILSYTLYQLAYFAKQRGDIATALRHASESHAIDKHLVTLDSANICWQDDVDRSRRFLEKLREESNT